MNSSAIDTMKALASEFRRKFDDFEGLYLFGLFTDGREHVDEDIEVVALFKTQDKSKREDIWRIIGKIETDMDVCLDLYPYTQEEFEQDEEVYSSVMKSGIYFDRLGIRKDKEKLNG